MLLYEDFEILYDDDVIDFPDDLPQIEEIHQEEVNYVMDNTQEVLQEINSKQDPQWGSNPFNEGVKV